VPSHAEPADAESIERWLTTHGVPSFVAGYASPRKVAPWAAAGALAAGLLATATLAVGGGLTGWLPNAVAVLVVAVGAAVISWAVVASAIIPLAIFAVRWFAQTVLRGGTSMLSVVPLLLVAVAFLFLGTETWQTIGRLHGLPLVLAALLFGGLGVWFVTLQIRPDLDGLAFASADELGEALPQELRVSPELVGWSWSQHPAPAELGRAERWNLQAVTALAQITVASVVGLAIFTFFMVFGTLVVDTATVTSWTTEKAQIWWQARLAGHTYALTSEHARVSAFLGVFSAFYFVVSASTNGPMRASLTEGARRHAYTCLAVRAVYRAHQV
jgi:hypothetical protein